MSSSACRRSLCALLLLAGWAHAGFRVVWDAPGPVAGYTVTVGSETVDVGPATSYDLPASVPLGSSIRVDAYNALRQTVSSSNVLAVSNPPAAATGVSVRWSRIVGIAREGYAASGTSPGSANTGSFDITVPANTNCLIVYASGYDATADYFTGTGASVTCEGAAADSVITGSDSNSSYFMGAGWVFLSPTTGANVTIAWNWVGTGTAAYAPQFIWVAYSGVGSIRSATGNQVASGNRSIAVTASSGDVVSVAVFGYGNSECSVTTWSNATEITEYTINATNADLTLAEHSPSGNVTIATTALSSYDDGGIMAVVMVPSGGGSTLTPTIGSGTFAGIASRNDRGIFLPTEVNP